MEHRSGCLLMHTWRGFLVVPRGLPKWDHVSVGILAEICQSLGRLGECEGFISLLKSFPLGSFCVGNPSVPEFMETTSATQFNQRCPCDPTKSYRAGMWTRHTANCRRYKEEQEKRIQEVVQSKQRAQEAAELAEREAAAEAKRVSSAL